MPHSNNINSSPRRTHPIIWCVAIICTFLAILLIFLGVVIFVGYLFYRPKIPYVTVTHAHLDQFNYDQAGVLHTRLTIVFRAENDNIRANASFSSFHYELSFHGIAVARLVNYPFNVGKHTTLDFHYLVESDYIPLDPDRMDMVQRSMKENRVGFELRGHTRTRWRVGPFRSVRFWCNLNCDLRFRRDDGSNIDSHCTSRAR